MRPRTAPLRTEALHRCPLRWFVPESPRPLQFPTGLRRQFIRQRHCKAGLCVGNPLRFSSVSGVTRTRRNLQNLQQEAGRTAAESVGTFRNALHASAAFLARRNLSSTHHPTQQVWSVSNGVQTDETCQFKNDRLQRFNASSIGPLLVHCPSGS